MVSHKRTRYFENCWPEQIVKLWKSTQIKDCKIYVNSLCDEEFYPVEEFVLKLLFKNKFYY